jgi:hypothetical protein
LYGTEKAQPSDNLQFSQASRNPLSHSQSHAGERPNLHKVSSTSYVSVAVCPSLKKKNSYVHFLLNNKPNLLMREAAMDEVIN